jgi:hypothetical protein
MIYLIKVAYEKVTLLKVGYSKNIKKRLDQYTTENPLFELLDYREGDRKLEELLHDLFKEYKFEKGREWFYYNDYIVDNFHFNFKEYILIERIKKKIDKTKLFSRKLKLYCEFKERFSEIEFIVDDLQKYIDILGINKCKELRYREDFLYKEICDSGIFEEFKRDENKIINDFLSECFFKTNKFRERMKMYCEFSDYYRDNNYILEALRNRVDQKYYKYYKYYGTSGCSARKFQETYLLSGWEDSSKESLIEEEIYQQFSVNDRIAKSEIKTRLYKIYEKLSLNKKAKASDLGEYFKLSKTNVLVDGVPKNGFKLGEKLR